MISMYNLMTRYEELRLDSEKKQGEIAEILGVKANTYSKWENCINDMNLEKSNALANYYRTSLDYLLGLSNTREPSLVRYNVDYQILARRIRKLRLERHLTQDYLSRKLGFPQTTYTQYENGKTIPTTLKLLVIAQYYHVSIDYLVGRTDDFKIK